MDKPIPEAALQAARVAYGSSMPDEERMRAALAAAVPHLTAAQQQGQAVAWRSEVERAIERARVFDDGSDGADSESAQSVVAILTGLLNAQPMQQGGGEVVSYERALDLFAEVYNAGRDGIGYNKQATDLFDARTDHAAAALIRKCRSALAEELAAWDIDPPLAHVKEAHDACAAFLAGNAAPPSAPVGVAKAWQEGYSHGVQDERTSEDNIGIAGFNAKVEPARVNPYLAKQPAAVDGVALIAMERRRQVEIEGWTPEHDDEHDAGAMAYAAACYAYGAPFVAGVTVWPWSADWWKPTDRIRDLTKAGALIAAEIDRLQRATLTEARNG